MCFDATLINTNISTIKTTLIWQNVKYNVYCRCMQNMENLLSIQVLCLVVTIRIVVPTLQDSIQSLLSLFFTSNMPASSSVTESAFLQPHPWWPQKLLHDTLRASWLSLHLVRLFCHICLSG